MFIGCEVADAEYEKAEEQRYSRAQRPSARGAARRAVLQATVLC